MCRVQTFLTIDFATEFYWLIFNGQSEKWAPEQQTIRQSHKKASHLQLLGVRRWAVRQSDSQAGSSYPAAAALAHAAYAQYILRWWPRRWLVELFWAKKFAQEIQAMMKCFYCVYWHAFLMKQTVKWKIAAGWVGRKGRSWRILNDRHTNNSII